MKTIEEMSARIERENCSKYSACNGCLLEHAKVRTCYTVHDKADEKQVEENYKLLFGTPNDPVNHPSHYNKGKIEVSDFIADQKLNFDRGNAVKYVCRAGAKDPDKEIQDLEKAIWYINHEIKMLKGEVNNGTEREN